MYKFILTRLIILIMSVNISLFASDEWVFEKSFRLGYQYHKVEEKEHSIVALGKRVHIETPSIYGLSLGGTVSTSIGNGKEGFDGVPFFDEENRDYLSISEAYLRWTIADTTIVLGRQTFDTPFADSDDIGMVANSFEAITIVDKSIEDTTLFLGHIQRWSGVDSPTPSQFTDVNTDNGMQIVGVEYSGIKNTEILGYFYNLPQNMWMSYLEANYLYDTDDFSYGVGVQYVYQKYDNKDTSSIYGLYGLWEIKSIGITNTLSYNRTKGIPADNLFGGGAFFTNAEHNTLKEAGADGNTILYNITWDASTIGADGLEIHIDMDAHHGKGYSSEYDVGVTYEYNDKLDFSMIYSHIDDNDESFENLRVFGNYRF